MVAKVIRRLDTQVRNAVDYRQATITANARQAHRRLLYEAQLAERPVDVHEQLLDRVQRAQGRL